ncbi:MAG: hypothetical protein AUH29_06350 [Candidatus Rokubacteria bacterium 13_1_40CM_69_27]|nr:MAG: hypothetical protein AUH29_06350 [Candidatus Rokubacteria bacterium 13_1_40CM_69_27]
MTLVEVPTLEAIARDPAVAVQLPPDARAELLARALAVVGALAAPAVAVNGAGAGAPREDRLLDVQEAARRLNVSTDYIYRHSREWPFTVRRGRKLGFSEQGLTEYLHQVQRRRQAPLT